jgi:HK97 family phage major capsid protein
MPSRCFGDWLRRVYHGDVDGLSKVYGSQPFTPTSSNPKIKAAMTENTGLQGAYAVPSEYGNSMLKTMAEKAIFRQRCHVEPMGSRTKQLGVVDAISAHAAGISPFFGGLTFFYQSEGQTRTEVEPTFRQMELTAWELSGYCVVNNTWLEDAVGNENWFKQLLIDACRWVEDYAFTQGTGVGQPLGILNAPCAIKVGRTTASHIRFADFSAMLAKLPPGSLNRAMWLVSEGALIDFTQAQDASGRASWLPNDGIENLADRTGQPLGSVMSCPVYATEKLPALGTLGDLCLIDPAWYIIGDRQEIAIDIARQATLTTWQQNKSVIRVILRSDGQPVFPSSITLQDNATTVSPIVLLN